MKRAHVAIVDDEEPVRVALARLLRLDDYEVSTFASGEDFLNSLDARVPDCVVLDVHMPGLTGFEVQKRLQGRPVAIPIVFITASDALDVAESATQAKSPLLHKPFSNDALVRAVEDTMRHRPLGGH